MTLDEIKMALADLDKKYDAMPKELLKVSFFFVVPYSCYDFVRLDGILAWLAMEDLLGEHFFDIPKNTEEALLSPAPIEKRMVDGNIFYYRCSYGLVGENTRETVSSWKKRWDDKNDDIVKVPEKKKFRIEYKCGFFRAYQMPVPLTLTNRLDFFCYGNKEEIERLLKNLKFVGKKTSQGWGEIRKVEVVSTDQDFSEWLDKNKFIPSRAIPISNATYPNFTEMAKLGRLHLSMIGYKPPYWHAVNRACCYGMVKR